MTKSKGSDLEGQPYICVIGAANVDIIGASSNSLTPKDDCPGHINMMMGGVGRNIAETLARLQQPTKLLTCFGNDLAGHSLREHCIANQIDIEDSMVSDDVRSSVHMAIMDEKGDIALGISDMNICDKLDSSFLLKKKPLIENSAITIADTNITKDALQFLSSECKNQKLYLDAVSATKARRALPLSPNWHTAKVNRQEAEVLTGIKIKNGNDYTAAAEILIELGINRVYISAGADGVFYCDKNEAGMLAAIQTQVKNTNGAGDAFVAGSAYAFSKNMSTRESAKIGIACATLTAESNHPVNPSITLEKVLAIAEKIR